MAAASASPSVCPTLPLFSGASIPVVGLGTWNSPKGEVQKAVVAAIESGYRHIDCAAGYGNEAEVGAAVADVISRGIVKREDLFITSKLWVTKAHPEDVEGALNQSLTDLGLSYLDLYLVHWPYRLTKGCAFPPPSRDDVTPFDDALFLLTWRELEKAVDAGKTRHIGTSNMSGKRLAALLTKARIQPAVNQVEAHPFLAQRRMKALCDAHKIVLIAFSPLGSPARPARLIEEGDPSPLFDETVLGLAGKYSVSAAQILVRWAVQRGTVTIPKSVTADRISENFKVFGFEIDAADMAELAKLDSGSRLIKGYPFMTSAMTHWREHWDEDWEKANIKLD